MSSAVGRGFDHSTINQKITEPVHTSQYFCMKMSITNGKYIYINFYFMFNSFFVEISLYEVHRKPHEVVIDDSLIAVSPRALHAELMCPICLDLMRNTQTTKEVSQLGL